MAELEAERAQLLAQVAELQEQAGAQEEALQAELASRDALLQEQQATILQLRSSISEQQEDIRVALGLVTGRAPPATAAAARPMSPQRLRGSVELGQYTGGGVVAAAGGLLGQRAQTSYSDPLLHSCTTWAARPHSGRYGSPPRSAAAAAAGNRYVHSAHTSPYKPLQASPVRTTAGATSAQTSPAWSAQPARAAQPGALPYSSTMSTHSKYTAAPSAQQPARTFAPGSLAAARLWSPGKATQQQQQAPPTRSTRSVHQISRLKLDMQSLDNEIADLEATLKTAAARLT